MRKRMQVLSVCAVAAAMAAIACQAGTVRADVVFANFEDGTTNGVGYLSSSSGVQPFPASPGPTASVITPSSGTDTTKVLDINGAGYNGGQSGGTDVGYDFVAMGNLSDFMANHILSFDWEVAPSSTSSGFSQIYQVVLNAPGLGYQAVGGTSSSEGTTANNNQYPGYTGQLNTYSLDYSAYKSLISANPSYVQLGIVTNNGGGAPPEIYFDNFRLSGAAPVPEPATCGLLAVGAVALLRRRR